jgi:hypothetical protein
MGHAFGFKVIPCIGKSGSLPGPAASRIYSSSRSVDLWLSRQHSTFKSFNISSVGGNPPSEIFDPSRRLPVEAVDLVQSVHSMDNMNACVARREPLNSVA